MSPLIPVMTGSYNGALIVASFLVATVAAYVALSMVGRITASSGRAAKWWLAGGASAMGFGIWSMHFIGMLAFKLPIPQGYDLLITGYSLLIAIAASAYALWMVTRPTLPGGQLFGGGLIMGCGIAAMHYVGMAAMRMQPGIDYDPLWFVLSVLVAVVTAVAALWIFFRLRSEARRHPFALRIAAAAVMGLAIAGMHYTGMAAARFPEGSLCGAALYGGVSTRWLASLVGTFSVSILSIALLVSWLDRRLQERTAHLADSLAQAKDELSQLALHDSLTRLPNRTLMEARLAQAIVDAQRTGGRFAVMFIDLDGFKAINDTYGHQAGDRVLLHLASRMSDSLRPQDTIARLGGDEFVVLAPVDSREDAAIIAHRLLHLACMPLDTDCLDIAVSASIGVAIHPQDGLRAQDLLANADAAMYSVKESGRNGCQLFEPQMQHGARQRIALIQQLRDAIRRDELHLEYLPKLQAPEGPELGVAAAVRWRHPERGELMPADFVPLAERSGLSIELGRWVLDRACGQMAAWRDRGMNPGSMAIPLSPTQFHSELLHQHIQDALQRHGLPGSLLVLEISEAMVMQDPAGALRILQQLSQLDVSVSIDDFGDGYSRLRPLKDMPASELKIGRGVLHQLTADGNDPAVASAIVALGHALGLPVTASGVEPAEQRELLSRFGFTALQGQLAVASQGAAVTARTHPPLSQD